MRLLNAVPLGLANRIASDCCVANRIASDCYIANRVKVIVAIITILLCREPMGTFSPSAGAKVRCVRGRNESGTNILR